MKKILNFILVLVIIFSMFITPVYAEEEQPVIPEATEEVTTEPNLEDEVITEITPDAETKKLISEEDLTKKEEIVVKEIVKEEIIKEEEVVKVEKEEIKVEPQEEEIVEEKKEEEEIIKEEPEVEEEIIETQTVIVQFQVIKPSGAWANAGGGSSVTIQKGENGSKTFTVNTADKKDVTINGTDDIYQYLGTWGNGEYDASSGKIKLDRATTFNKYKTDKEAVVTVYIRADYNIIKNYYLDINYIDNVANGGGGDSHYNNKTTYYHTFRTPADIPTQYDFLYWKNETTGDTFVADDIFTVEANSISADTTIDFYAWYNYQPGLQIIYHYGDNVKSTSILYENVDDITAYAPIEAKWYDADNKEVISAALAEKILTNEKLDIVNKVDVYAKFTVEWHNDDKALLEKDEFVPYDTMPEYNSDTPTKSATAQYTYTFKEWTPILTPVVKDISYFATFNAKVNQYTVTFKNEDGKVLSETKYDWGTKAADVKQPTATKPATAQYTYVFAGWDKPITDVITDVTYTAKYTAALNAYTVTWVNDDGAVLKVDNLYYGTMPTYNNAAPTKASTPQYDYTFSGWTPTIVPVTGNAIYMAVYTTTTRAYLVTFLPGAHGTFAPTQSYVLYGSAVPAAPIVTGEEGFEFVNWDMPISGRVYGDMTFTAMWKELPVEEPVPEPTPTPEIIEVKPDDVPMASAINSWALVNLILLVFTIFTLWKGKKKEYTVFTPLAIVIALILFIWTEDVHAKMIIVDKWTLLQLLIYAIGLLSRIFAKKQEDEEEPEEVPTEE